MAASMGGGLILISLCFLILPLSHNLLRSDPSPPLNSRERPKLARVWTYRAVIDP